MFILLIVGYVNRDCVRMEHIIKHTSLQTFYVSHFPQHSLISLTLFKLLNSLSISFVRFAENFATLSDVTWWPNSHADSMCVFVRAENLWINLERLFSTTTVTIITIMIMICLRESSNHLALFLQANKQIWASLYTLCAYSESNLLAASFSVYFLFYIFVFVAARNCSFAPLSE